MSSKNASRSVLMVRYVIAMVMLLSFVANASKKLSAEYNVACCPCADPSEVDDNNDAVPGCLCTNTSNKEHVYKTGDIGEVKCSCVVTVCLKGHPFGLLLSEEQRNDDPRAFCRVPNCKAKFKQATRECGRALERISYHSLTKAMWCHLCELEDRPTYPENDYDDNYKGKIGKIRYGASCSVMIDGTNYICTKHETKTEYEAAAKAAAAAGTEFTCHWYYGFVWYWRCEGASKHYVCDGCYDEKVQRRRLLFSDRVGGRLRRAQLL